MCGVVGRVWEGISSLIITESLALRSGIELAIHLRIEKIILEGVSESSENARVKKKKLDLS